MWFYPMFGNICLSPKQKWTCIWIVLAWAREEAHECLLTTCKTKLQLGIIWPIKQRILETHISFPPCTQWHPYKITLLGK
jgi:hypothetical protein